jgi:hypothetical protein
MNKQIDRIAFEFWSGIGSKSDLEDWAEEQLRKDDPHPDACELFNLSDEDAEKESIRLAKEIAGFSPTSEQGEKWAQELLSEYCQKLLDEEITPLQFCNLVNQFDGGFLGARDIGEGLAYYPEWLGDLWNNCDWCDESWDLANSPHLAEEAKKVMINET